MDWIGGSCQRSRRPPAYRDRLPTTNLTMTPTHPRLVVQYGRSLEGRTGKRDDRPPSFPGRTHSMTIRLAEFIRSELEPILQDWERFAKTILPARYMGRIELRDQAVAESLEQRATVKGMETRLFGAILVASPDPICILDLERRFIYANRATADLLALAPEAIIGKSALNLGFSFGSEFERHIEQVVSDRATPRGQVAHTFASGQGERFDYVLAPVVDEDDNTEATVCIFRDITEQALAEERIWHSAHHDLLTALPNRRLCLDRREQEVKHARRGGLHLALLFMDLDGFKEVNDSFGHEAGDRLLREVAERITRCVREEDTVGRLGGDEFTVILTGARDGEGVERAARSIVDALAEPFHVAREPVQVSVSIGVSAYPQHASSPVALLETADQAMYQAMSSGANRIRCYGAPEG
jgi:diguanylate cyclase (GGDEF)-like protein/PAS domain S-box-containing protein